MLVNETCGAVVYPLALQGFPLQRIEVTGAAASTVTSLLFTASALPATSQDRYFTVVVAEIGMGALYSVLVVVGSVPSVVYRVLATPEPPVLSVAARETETPGA
ncbi:hypothetical protein BJM39_27235 [Salmonella enterica subsp. enterica serovar Javiana]|nr:hypothetical protein BJM39_27235 [Salmonella enterica subsp. enterica serovar Javiana]